MTTTTMPAFSGTRVQEMPVRLNNMDSIPPSLEHYGSVISKIFAASERKEGGAYLTIDERFVPRGKSHRHPGLHVDGSLLEFQGTPTTNWGARSAFVLSNIAGCRAWNQRGIQGAPRPDGECDHLLPLLHPENAAVFEANRIYWMAELCVHESMPLEADSYRQFVRLTIPFSQETDVWFEGYTLNPLGVLPTGKIMPRRPQMQKYAAAKN